MDVSVAMALSMNMSTRLRVQKAQKFLYCCLIQPKKYCGLSLKLAIAVITLFYQIGCGIVCILASLYFLQKAQYAKNDKYNITLELKIILLSIGIVSLVRCIAGLLGFISIFIQTKYAQAFYFFCQFVFLLDIALLILVNVQLKLIQSEISTNIFQYSHNSDKFTLNFDKYFQYFLIIQISNIVISFYFLLIVWSYYQQKLKDFRDKMTVQPLKKTPEELEELYEGKEKLVKKEFELQLIQKDKEIEQLKSTLDNYKKLYHKKDEKTDQNSTQQSIIVPQITQNQQLIENSYQNPYQTTQQSFQKNLQSTYQSSQAKQLNGILGLQKASTFKNNSYLKESKVVIPQVYTNETNIDDEIEELYQTNNQNTNRYSDDQKLENVHNQYQKIQNTEQELENDDDDDNDDNEIINLNRSKRGEGSKIIFVQERPHRKKSKKMSQRILKNIEHLQKLNDIQDQEDLEELIEEQFQRNKKKKKSKKLQFASEYHTPRVQTPNNEKNVESYFYQSAVNSPNDSLIQISNLQKQLELSLSQNPQKFKRSQTQNFKQAAQMVLQQDDIIPNQSGSQQFKQQQQSQVPLYQPKKSIPVNSQIPLYKQIDPQNQRSQQQSKTYYVKQRTENY